MTSTEFNREMKKHRKQIEKVKKELAALEEKRRKMTADVDRQIAAKQEELDAMVKCLQRVERLQKQIAAELGMNENKRAAAPVKKDIKKDEEAVSPLVEVLQEPDDEVNFGMMHMDEKLSSDDPADWFEESTSGY